MRALQLAEPKNFRMIDVPEANKPGQGEALVRVHRVGVCGTDVGGYLGKMPFFSYPRIPGHELGVEVVEVGGGVTNVTAGDRCAVEPYINDPNSYASRIGKPNCCEKLQVLGVHTDGGLRPYFVVPARKLHVGNGLEFEQLALVETLAIGRHAVSRGEPKRGETCLIIGAGPIGLATLEFVKLAGATPVMLDSNPARLEFCRSSMGVEHTLAPSEQLGDELRALTDGHGPECVIDATGSNVAMSNSFSLVAPGGRLVFVGITAGDVTFKHPIFHKVEGTLLCSRNALPADFAAIIESIRKGEINTGPWVTHRVGFGEVIGAFPTFCDPNAGVVKAVIDVGA